MMALLFIGMGIYDEFSTIVDISFGADMLGAAVIQVVDGLLNKVMTQLIAVDFTINALVKLRVYNGYMADDTDLTNLSCLFHFSEKVNKWFAKGVSEHKKKEERQLQLQLHQLNNKNGVTESRDLTSGSSIVKSPTTTAKGLKLTFPGKSKSFFANTKSRSKSENLEKKINEAFSPAGSNELQKKSSM